MTFIHPAKQSALTKFLIALIAASVLCSLGLVVIYNNIVNMEHGISSMRQELKKAQAENIALKEGIFALFDSSKFNEIIDVNLVQEKNPDYFEISQRWAFAPHASQY